MVKSGEVGPFTARAIVVGERNRSAHGRLGVEATLTDDGRGSRVIATASASFRTAPVSPSASSSASRFAAGGVD